MAKSYNKTTVETKTLDDHLINMENVFSTKFRRYLPSPAIIVALSVLIILAGQVRFIQDDAFISFRYAHNLAQGNGLVWNIGEHVEGYTSFLWVIIMSIPHFLGINVELFSYLVGLSFFAGALYIFDRIMNERGFSIWQKCLGFLVLGTNYVFLSYATSGMETMLVTLWITLLLLIVVLTEHTPQESQYYIVFSLVLCLALLTRLDAAIVAFPMIIMMAIRFHRYQKLADTPTFLKMMIPWMFFGIWFVWKVQYYGHLLPNTFAVKAATITSYRQGFIYVLLFVVGNIAFALIYRLIHTLSSRKMPNRFALVLGSSIILQMVYLIYVGGDFMDLRMFVVIMPLCTLLFLDTAKTKPLVFLITVWLLVANQIAGRLLADSRTDLLSYTGVDTIFALEQYIHGADHQWEYLGTTIGETLDHDPSVSLAVGPIGAIGYFSETTVIDMHGLTDDWVAHQGIIWSTRPGHQRVAPLSYLQDRKVNLIIGFPHVLDHASIPKELARVYEFIWFIPVEQLAQLPPQTTIVRIPLQYEKYAYALYLTPHPSIDQAIKTGLWTSEPLAKLFSKN
ncbi:hypothetical protein KC571_00380 [candidate division WWE3 bacterium]|uniref:Glycosyltransferase RgtA/B/C/D-like domain-containing protein n=1 Tax=candidate division WWE3 bacterium TaxID=2053526 RepID=A0A955LFX9_UNCKA|nr:hypothetical protein [candidate division WWE3 bacterium]